MSYWNEWADVSSLMVSHRRLPHEARIASTDDYGIAILPLWAFDLIEYMLAYAATTPAFCCRALKVAKGDRKIRVAIKAVMVATPVVSEGISIIIDLVESANA